MKRMLSLVGLVFFVGCGHSSSTQSGTTNFGSCQASSVCQDLVGAQYAAAPFAKTCAAGNYSSSSCPTANLVGSCDLNRGLPNESINRFYSTGDTPYTIISAPLDCQAGQYTQN